MYQIIYTIVKTFTILERMSFNLHSTNRTFLIKYHFTAFLIKLFKMHISQNEWPHCVIVTF